MTHTRKRKSKQKHSLGRKVDVHQQVLDVLRQDQQEDLRMLLVELVQQGGDSSDKGATVQPLFGIAAHQGTWAVGGRREKTCFFV